jgi:hypothetical protein
MKLQILPMRGKDYIFINRPLGNIEGFLRWYNICLEKCVYLCRPINSQYLKGQGYESNEVWRHQCG